MEKMIFQVTGMHCAGCAANVERSVKKLSGVSEVYVSIGSRTMELQRDPSVVTTEEILEAVWGRDYYGEVKIVDVNIRRLRIKVEDDPTSPTYITTVWGYGYKWGF